MQQRSQTLAQNRHARRNYEVLNTLEAGLVLLGTEVKSVRAGGVSLSDAYCTVRGSEAFLVNAHIAPYSFANRDNHSPLRDRKLLLHHRQIQELRKHIEQKGLTVIPLKMYLSAGRIKMEIAFVRGKRAYDKRQTILERDTKRKLDRVLKSH